VTILSTPIRKLNITSWLTGAAITDATICVCNAVGVVVKGAGANDANVVGVSIQAAGSGEPIELAGIGDIVWLTAGAAITHGARIVCGDSSGRGIDCAETAATTYNVVGFALDAVSNADELFPCLINIFTHTVET